MEKRKTDPYAQRAIVVSMIGFEKRRRIDGRIEYFGMVYGSKWPAEGPRELWGLEVKPTGNHVIAVDRHMQRQLYRFEIFAQTRPMKDGSYLVGRWYGLKYEGPYA